MRIHLKLFVLLLSWHSISAEVVEGFDIQFPVSLNDWIVLGNAREGGKCYIHKNGFITETLFIVYEPPETFDTPLGEWNYLDQDKLVEDFLKQAYKAWSSQNDSQCTISDVSIEPKSLFCQMNVSKGKKQIAFGWNRDLISEKGRVVLSYLVRNKHPNVLDSLTPKMKDLASIWEPFMKESFLKQMGIAGSP